MFSQTKKLAGLGGGVGGWGVPSPAQRLVSTEQAVRVAVSLWGHFFSLLCGFCACLLPGSGVRAALYLCMSLCRRDAERCEKKAVRSGGRRTRAPKHFVCGPQRVTFWLRRLWAMKVCRGSDLGGGGGGGRASAAPR